MWFNTGRIIIMKRDAVRSKQYRAFCSSENAMIFLTEQRARETM